MAAIALIAAILEIGHFEGDHSRFRQRHQVRLIHHEIYPWKQLRNLPPQFLGLKVDLANREVVGTEVTIVIGPESRVSEES